MVTRIMQHVLMCLKQDNPELKEAFYRQDNAGCYHSVPAILCCEQLSSKTGVKISRCDFSDPQGGKGPCDQLAATTKAHINLFINEGHDVTNAKELTKALLSNGGMEAVRVAHVDAGAQTSVPPGSECNLDGISYYNNFQFGKEGLTAWHAYNIGVGKFFPWSRLKGMCILFLYRQNYIIISKTRNKHFLSNDPHTVASCWLYTV